MFIAHRTPDGREQPLSDHLNGTAILAEAFAQPFGAEKVARALGLVHDIGKYSEAFQRRIRGANISVDHATAGAQEIVKYFGWLAAYCAAGHHGGLPDGGGGVNSFSESTLTGRLKRPVEPYGDFSKEIQLKRDRVQPPRIMGKGGFTLSFWTRMLFSCLVDADFLDTEAFMRETPPPRGSQISVEDLLPRLEDYISRWWDAQSELNRARCTVLRACLDAGQALSPGLFTLTVPTGGGKTVSSLAFALRHAKKYGKKRIIYVIPYTSIIEQTADKFREILGGEAVLEHHSNVDLDGDENGSLDLEMERKKLASENWDMPVVVTTAVQFFESLFANRPSRCRKLHNLANSVIIFDEAQTIPLPYLLPCVRAIAELTVNFGASCVLCTATQPALGPLFASISPDLVPREIAPKIPERIFQRVQYEKLGQLSDEDLAGRLNAHDQVLCIVNTRKQAQTLYALLDREGSFHLSTLMTPTHRRAVLEEIKQRLEKGISCRVVSTSLIEAGVDVDFPVVYRAEAGLDSIVQAAGRCNREGKRDLCDSYVYIFQPDSAYAATLPHSMKRPVELMRSVTGDGSAVDDAATIERYFTDLRQFAGEEIDSQQIVPRFERGLQDANRPLFPFAEVASQFHLISQNTRAVLIPNESEAKQLAKRLQNGERSRALLRKAGQYIVNVYEKQLDALSRHGALQPVENDLFILTDLDLYSSATGLALLSDSGEGIFL